MKHLAAVLTPLRRIYRTAFGSQKEWYRTVRRILGVTPDNIELYKLALLHRSASVFLDDGTPINNERLEFLGDAILEAVVSDFLFIEFPTENEGFLTQMRSKIVSRASLNELAQRMGLMDHVVYNSNGNHAQKHLYGDALEAMIGAMYLDKGYDLTNRLLINEIFRKHLDVTELTSTEIDFKSRLIEWCQKSRRTITFNTTFSPQSTGSHPDFIARVMIDSVEMGYGHGHSKKEAEQNASFMLSELVTSDIRTDHILEMTDEHRTVATAEPSPKSAPEKKKRSRKHSPAAAIKPSAEPVAAVEQALPVEKKKRTPEPKAAPKPKAVAAAKPAAEESTAAAPGKKIRAPKAPKPKTAPAPEESSPEKKKPAPKRIPKPKKPVDDPSEG